MTDFAGLPLHEIALGIAIVLTALSQVLLRAGGMGKGRSLTAVYLNLKTVLGYFMFAIVILLTIYAMQQIPLRTVTAFSGLTFILVPLLARWFIKDPLNKRILMGSGVIVLGILIYLI